LRCSIKDKRFLRGIVIAQQWRKHSFCRKMVLTGNFITITAGLARAAGLGQGWFVRRNTERDWSAGRDGRR